MRALDEIDRSIIVATQDGLPLAPDPYGVIADALGLDVDLVMARMTAMAADGIIRRIGVVPNHYALGYRFNGMSVWDVADEDVEEAGRRLCAPGFVSHCYQRPRRLPSWPYNLFTMVHGHDRAQVEAAIAALAVREGVDHYPREALFSTRRFKQCGARYTPRQAAE